MLEIKVISSMGIKDIVSIAAIHNGDCYKLLQKGSILTDGVNKYVVESLTLANFKSTEAMSKKVAFTLKQGNFDPLSLQGKTLSLVAQ